MQCITGTGNIEMCIIFMECYFTWQHSRDICWDQKEKRGHLFFQGHSLLAHKDMVSDKSAFLIFFLIFPANPVFELFLKFWKVFTSCFKFLKTWSELWVQILFNIYSYELEGSIYFYLVFHWFNWKDNHKIRTKIFADLKWETNKLLVCKWLSSYWNCKHDGRFCSRCILDWKTLLMVQ